MMASGLECLTATSTKSTTNAMLMIVGRWQTLWGGTVLRFIVNQGLVLRQFNSQPNTQKG